MVIQDCPPTQKRFATATRRVTGGSPPTPSVQHKLLSTRTLLPQRDLPGATQPRNCGRLHTAVDEHDRARISVSLLTVTRTSTGAGSRKQTAFRPTASTEQEHQADVPGQRTPLLSGRRHGRWKIWGPHPAHSALLFGRRAHRTTSSQAEHEPAYGTRNLKDPLSEACFPAQVRTILRDRPP